MTKRRTQDELNWGTGLQNGTLERWIMSRIQTQDALISLFMLYHYDWSFPVKYSEQPKICLWK